MERETGSNPVEVEIMGGPYDGAVGIVRAREERDGQVFTQVELPDGTVVTLAGDVYPRVQASTETPRELGS